MDEDAIVRITDDAQQLALVLLTAMVNDESELSESLTEDVAAFVGLEMPSDATAIFRSWILANSLASFTVSALKIASRSNGVPVTELMRILALSRQIGLDDN